MVVSYNVDPSTEPGLLHEEQVFLTSKSSLQALMLKLNFYQKYLPDTGTGIIEMFTLNNSSM